MEDFSQELYNLFNQGRFSEVIQFSKSHSISPQSSPIASQILAASYFKNGDFDESYSILSELESVLGTESDFLSLYAAASRRVGKFQLADSLFKRALSISPNTLEIQNNYANLLIDLKRYDEALKILNNALSVNPSYQDAQFNKNRLQQLISSQSSELSPELGKTNSSSSLDIGDPLLLAFEQDEVDYSVKRYFPKRTDSNLTTDNFPEPNPNSVLLDQLKFAELALKNRNSTSALKICSKALRTFGQQAQIYDIASDAYLQLNKVSQSELCLLHAVALSGKSIKRCLNLASFAMMRHNYQLAEAYIAEASALDPSSDLLDKSKKLLHTHKANHTHPFVFKQVWEEPDLCAPKA